MIDSLRIQVSLMGKFLGFESSKEISFPAVLDTRLPKISIFAVAYAKKAITLFVTHGISLILMILRVSGLSKVGYSVIRSLSIDVINKKTWPGLVDVKPRKPMSPEYFSIDSYHPVPFSISTSGKSVETPALSCFVPKEQSSIRVVCKKFLQTFWGKIAFSHDTVPSLIGQRPACVISTGGPRHFNLYFGV